MTKKEYDVHPLSQLSDQQLDEFLEKAEATFSEEHQKTIYENFIEKQGKSKRKLGFLGQTKWLVAAVACVLLVPTTVFGATKLWQLLVERNQHSLTVNIAKSKEPQKWYQVKLGYVPSQLQANTEAPLVFWAETQDLPVISMQLIYAKEQTKFEESYIGNHQEVTIGAHRALIADKEGQAYSKYRQVIYLLFEEEGYVLQVYVGEGISEAELNQMLAEVTLQESSEAEATPSLDYDYELLLAQQEKNQPEESSDSGLISEEQFVELNQEVSPLIEQGQLAIKATKVKVLDSIAGLDWQFTLMGNLDELIDSGGGFIPFEAKIYRYGDGKTTTDSLVATKTLELRLILISVTVTNRSGKRLEDFDFSPNLFHLNEMEGGYQAQGQKQPPVEPYGFQHSYFLSYLDKHGEGKGYAQISKLEPNQSVDLQLGYFVTTDELKDNFLEINLSLNQYETLADEGRQWIKVN